MFIVNEWALQYFQDVLKNDPDGIAIGKQYFRSRGIRDDIVEKFSLGFALPKRDALALAAQKAGYKAEFLGRRAFVSWARKDSTTAMQVA